MGKRKDSPPPTTLRLLYVERRRGEKMCAFRICVPPPFQTSSLLFRSRPFEFWGSLKRNLYPARAPFRKCVQNGKIEQQANFLNIPGHFPDLFHFVAYAVYRTCGNSIVVVGSDLELECFFSGSVILRILLSSPSLHQIHIRVDRTWQCLYHINCCRNKCF